MKKYLTYFVFMVLTALPLSQLIPVSTASAAVDEKYIRLCAQFRGGINDANMASCRKDITQTIANKCKEFNQPQAFMACYSANAPKEPAGCAGIDTSIIKCDNKGGNPVVSLVLQVINFMAVGVGIAVVGGIIWGGMRYASSNGDASKAKQGVTTIVNAVVGLLLFIFMYAFFNYLVPGGLFG